MRHATCTAHVTVRLQRGGTRIMETPQSSSGYLHPCTDWRKSPASSSHHLQTCAALFCAAISPSAISRCHHRVLCGCHPEMFGLGATSALLCSSAAFSVVVPVIHHDLLCPNSNDDCSCVALCIRCAEGWPNWRECPRMKRTRARTHATYCPCSCMTGENVVSTKGSEENFLGADIFLKIISCVPYCRAGIGSGCSHHFELLA